jgi:hypothetical protein
MPRFSDEQLESEVLFLLKQHVGKGNPIGRWEMVVRLYGAGADVPRSDDNFADRAIREAVERLRRRGVLICDMGDGRGRYLASSVDEYQEFRRRYGSAAFKTMATIHDMDEAAEQQWPNSLQPRLL